MRPRGIAEVVEALEAMQTLPMFIQAQRAPEVLIELARIVADLAANVDTLKERGKGERVTSN